jgi:hypothetical protein
MGRLNRVLAAGLSETRGKPNRFNLQEPGLREFRRLIAQGEIREKPPIEMGG